MLKPFSTCIQSDVILLHFHVLIFNLDLLFSVYCIALHHYFMISLLFHIVCCRTFILLFSLSVKVL